MRRITWWALSTLTALVLLFSYRTSLSGPTGTSAVAAAKGANAPGLISGPDMSGAPGPTPSPSAGGSASAAPAASPTAASPKPPAKAVDTVANGTVAQTRWGPVQVRVRISGGKIVDVSVLQQPDGNSRDQEINSYALPQLKQQVLGAQSANIDGVSGATVTSDGYRESLQAALDAAHFRG
jgi:uncharacterized protein with FMN-binding domain